MKYQRVVLVLGVKANARVAITATRRVAPNAEALIVVAYLPGHTLSWLGGDEGAAAVLDQLKEAAAASGASAVDVTLASDLDANILAELLGASRADLLVLAEPTLRLVSMGGEVRKRVTLPVLIVGSSAADDHPIREIVCEAIGSRARRAVGIFLRDHGTPELHVAVLAGPRLPGELSADLDIGGIGASVTLTHGALPKGPVDLLVLPRWPGALLAGYPWRSPLLVLPPAAAAPLHRAIDVPDLVDDTGVLRARFLYDAPVGRHEPIPDQEVAVVARGRLATVVMTRDGDAELTADLDSDSLGVFRAAEQGALDPLSAVEQEVRVMRSGTRPLVLFDATLGDDGLRALARLDGTDAPALLAVRMRPIQSCRGIRSRLRRFGLAPCVVDASAVLDEGLALDVGEDLDAVRLARVAARLRGDGGFLVAAIVHDHPRTPTTIGFPALRPQQVGGAAPPATRASGDTRSLATRLDATTGAAVIPGNRIEIECHNPTARRWLLDAIAGAKHRIHLQVYMAADDDVGSTVESALAEAGARGVTVRVAVDSLHGFEGSFGARNPVLERLRARPGVELRVLRPITGMPSVEDIKQRDHRKVAVVDGAVGLLGGRNLSHEYYTGFDEVTLTPESPWRQVPWLDAGARVEGPAVAALEASFLDAWTGAGGAPFDIVTPPAAGSTSARVIVHHGLRDARTLDAYLALIDSAESHINTVNGFPLILEIQHAMLRAIRRGVRVRSLVGNLTPRHGDIPFSGAWSSARAAATGFVHSRIDAIVAAGGEGYVFAVPPDVRRDDGLGVIHPHVHAKVVSVDGRICTVGSANLDVTAGYWENELMLLVEDESIAGAVDARIDQLLAASTCIDRNDAAWQRTAKRRDWMRHWPGLLSL